MNANSDALKSIWEEAYEEHGRLQDDAVRVTLEREDAGEIELVSHEEVIANLERRITSRVQPGERRETEWTDEQWQAFFHGMETRHYWETVEKIQADFSAAQTFDTATLSLAVTPTCIYALYVAARRSASVEDFTRISRELAEVFHYDREDGTAVGR